MIRGLFAVALVLSACGSSSSDGATAAGGSGAGGATTGGSCPDVSGIWKVTAHCDSSLIGMSLMVTETNCALSFAPPFDSFMGSVTAASKVTLSGPQSCTGDASSSAISMTCSPGTCLVKLAR